MAGARAQIVKPQRRLVFEGLLAPFADHKVRFHAGCGKGIERADAQYGATRPGNSDHDLLQKSIPNYFPYAGSTEIELQHKRANNGEYAMSQDFQFEPSLFKYLRDLKKNNERPWFKANKARYEDELRSPMLRFIENFAPHLEKISVNFLADPRPVGGSLFRIYRDTRFAKDKTPYKTHAGAHFRHVRAKDAHAPGFYLHMEPGNVFLGGGIWHPDSAALGKIREAIVKDPKRWKRLSTAKALAAANCTLVGDSLKRPPRGYDPDHPLITDLKRKDFILAVNTSEEDALSADFIKRFAKFCKTAAPMNEFITRALDLEW